MKKLNKFDSRKLELKETLSIWFSDKPKTPGDPDYNIELAIFYINQAKRMEEENNPDSWNTLAHAGAIVYHLPEGPTELIRLALELEPRQSTYLLLGYASEMTDGILFRGTTPSYLTKKDRMRRRQTRASIHKLLKQKLSIARDFLRY